MKIEIGNKDETFRCPKHGNIHGEDVIHLYLCVNGETIRNTYCGHCINSFLFNEVFMIDHKVYLNEDKTT